MSARTRLAGAALASLALHGLVISGNWVAVPDTAPDPQPLSARLAPAPPLKPAAPGKPPARARAPRPAAPAPAPEIITAAPGTIAFPEPATDAAPAEAVAEQPVAPEPPAQVALAAESSAVAARSLPRRGRITYSVLYGDSRTEVGRVVQSWQAENGSYRILSDAETTGIADLFRPQRLRYQSRGTMTEQGLRPEAFIMSRTRRGQSEVAEARFDWNAGSLAYGLAREPKSAPLTAGAQDFMSFIYQFVVLPPSAGRYRVPITTGSRFEEFDIEVGSEESIDTPIGTVRALSVRQLPRPGAESIQIWLAAEYRYLPVRIRHYDREGKYSGEQVVSEIRISEE